eukprot:5648506-Pyramimonas_sp.AAC.1
MHAKEASGRATPRHGAEACKIKRGKQLCEILPSRAPSPRAAPCVSFRDRTLHAAGLVEVMISVRRLQLESAWWICPTSLNCAMCVRAAGAVHKCSPAYQGA